MVLFTFAASLPFILVVLIIAPAGWCPNPNPTYGLRLLIIPFLVKLPVYGVHL